MRGSRRTIALLAAASVVVAVAVVLAVVLGTKKTAHEGVAPPCLPAAPARSAQLSGLPVYVSPAPDTGMANPDTQISFEGISSTQIHDVQVLASRSGRHAGRLRAYSQGDGASFLPNAPFSPGERVTVHAAIGDGATAKPVAFGFRVDTPYPTVNVPPFPNPPAPPSDYQSFATLPGVQAPILDVTVPDRDPAAGDVFTTNGPSPGRYGALIYTPQGRLVWFDQLSDGLSAENLSVQEFEGAPHLTFWQGKVLSLGFGQGEDVVMDSHYRTVARVAGGNGLKADLHDFQITPGGISYTTAFNTIRCDLSSIGGARDGAIVDTAVQAVDIETGLVRWEWHSLDHIAAAESETEAPKEPRPWDWFHLNSIDVQPNGDVLISARSTWASYMLKAGTGTILWRLGGNKSSFRMGPGTKTAWQHDARLLADGTLTLFDDGSNPPVHRVSRALKIALDYKRHEARLLSAYTHPAGLLTPSQGNMQTLPNGNSVVGYGGIPAVTEYAKDGTPLFDAHLPLEMDSYRAFRFPWKAQPAGPPAVLASLNNTGEETLVHMSWNGATDVARWRVLAGPRPSSLKSQATVPATGFESEAILPARYSYVAVQALDGAGHAMQTSPTTRVASYASAYPDGGTTG